MERLERGLVAVRMLGGEEGQHRAMEFDPSSKTPYSDITQVRTL